MKASFQFTEDEYARACWMHTKGKLNPRFDALVALGCIVFGIWSILEGNTLTGWGLLGLVGLLVGIVATSRYIVPRYVFRNHILGRGEYTFEFDDEGIHFTTDKIDSKIEWSTYTKVIRGPEHYLLYYSRNQFTIIPRRLFKTPDELETFEQLLKKHIPETVAQ